MGSIEKPRRTRAGMDIDGNEKRFKYYNYTNIDAVENMIHYVTRSRTNEQRAGDLIGYGAVGVGYYLTPDDMIRQFLYVQNIYGIGRRRGKRMHHETFNLCDQDVLDLQLTPEELCEIGRECSQVFYRMGYQVVFAVHWEAEKGFHIHFAVNSISSINGHKFRTNQEEREKRTVIYNQILQNHRFRTGGSISEAYDLGDDESGIMI